jgi:hypothetical protein
VPESAEPEEVAPRRPIHISRWARDFIEERGGSAYVWTKPFAGGFGLIASTTRPDGVDFELRSDPDDESVSVFVERSLLRMPLSLGFRRFPRPEARRRISRGAG